LNIYICNDWRHCQALRPQWKADGEREQGPQTTRPWADENGTSTGIVLAYPFSSPWHILILVRIMQYKKGCRITVATRAWDIGLRKHINVGFKNNSTVLLWQRETCVQPCILLFCQRRIALPFTYTLISSLTITNINWIPLFFAGKCRSYSSVIFFIWNVVWGDSTD